jgi:1-acyl-sn-glycerol-3-phosphate acyltransferase
MRFRTSPSILIRSTVFNILFYANLIALMIGGLPTLFMGPQGIMKLARLWGQTSLWLLRTVVGLDVEYRGLDKIPSGGFMIAPKHQSIWETFALLPLFTDFSFILKKELTAIPLFGWYLKVGRQIAIDRSRRSSALNEATAGASREIFAGRQVFIFPEGTRRPAGAPAAYKFGVASIYGAINRPCLPIALNSGLFWPRRSFIRRPGKVLVQILDPIEPGMERTEFFELLKTRLEAATDQLMSESLSVDQSLRQNLYAGA